MKKKLDSGFVLAETLIVTTFIAGVLIFLFVQFTNLSQKYNDSYKYNTPENLYSLSNIKDYILLDESAINTIEQSIEESSYLEITNCNIFTEKEYCLKLLELENIDKIFVSKNNLDKDLFHNFDKDFTDFLEKISYTGNEKYRLLASFNNSTYATIRFGD